MMKLLSILALLPAFVIAAPCPEKPNGFPCASWTNPRLMPNGQRVTPAQIKGHVVHYTRTLDGVTTRGQTKEVTDNSYYFSNAKKRALYRFWVVTVYSNGTMSEPSNIETAVRK